MEIRCYCLAGLLACSATATAQDMELVTVARLPAAPTLDGMLDEWGADGWQTIKIKPAVRNDEKNRTGELDVEIKTGVVNEMFYFAARWPDNKADTEYKPWEWKRNKYKRGKDRDDMFALRFDLEGDYDRCMVADADYKVDVWLWSAGRSGPAGLADDMWQQMSTSMLDNAAEHKSPSGRTVYIRKVRDGGNPIYRNTRPDRKNNRGPSLPGVELTGNHSGSVADVVAKGTWKDGFWNLEMSRKLDTGNTDDKALVPGQRVKGQIAVFNQGFSDHKSVSEPLLFDFE